jgi:hypothetical protein
MGQMLECQLEGFKGKFKILVWFVVFLIKKGGNYISQKTWNLKQYLNMWDKG